MTPIELIGIPQSTFYRATKIAALEKGAPFTESEAMPHSDPVNAISPAGRVPVARHGAVELCESRAIMGYIDAVFDGPALIPADPAERAVMDQWVSLINTWFDKVMIRDYLFAYLFPGTEDGAPDRARIEEALPVLEKQIAVLETGLAGRDYLAGDTASLADFDLIPILAYLAQMPESGALIAKSKHLSAYVARMSARQSVKDTVPPGRDGTGAAEAAE